RRAEVALAARRGVAPRHRSAPTRRSRQPEQLGKRLRPRVGDHAARLLRTLGGALRRGDRSVAPGRRRPAARVRLCPVRNWAHLPAVGAVRRRERELRSRALDPRRRPRRQRPPPAPRTATGGNRRHGLSLTRMIADEHEGDHRDRHGVLTLFGRDVLASGPRRRLRLLDQAFVYWRRRGFPYPVITRDRLTREFNLLVPPPTDGPLQPHPLPTP